jgi:hypothetical protein
MAGVLEKVVERCGKQGSEDVYFVLLALFHEDMHDEASGALELPIVNNGKGSESELAAQWFVLDQDKAWRVFQQDG